MLVGILVPRKVAEYFLLVNVSFGKSLELIIEQQINICHQFRMKVFHSKVYIIKNIITLVLFSVS
jgi:hypothetical protein